MAEKVKRAIAQTIERSAKEVRLATDAGKLQKLLTCLDRERGREFCGELLSTLRTCFSPVHRRRVELAKDKALKQFHTVRLSQLPGLWMALLADTCMSLNSISPLLLQSINRRVFESLMVEFFADAVATSQTIVVPVAPALNAEEENALRYVSGYVALKLMRKISKGRRWESNPVCWMFVEYGCCRGGVEFL